MPMLLTPSSGQQDEHEQDAIDAVIFDMDGVVTGSALAQGRAVRWLLNHTNLGAGDRLTIYIDDDLTDEDAFEELSGEGIGIVVWDGSRATAADYSLQDPEDVQRFLVWLSERSETA